MLIMNLFIHVSNNVCFLQELNCGSQRLFLFHKKILKFNSIRSIYTLKHDNKINKKVTF